MDTTNWTHEALRAWGGGDNDARERMRHTIAETGRKAGMPDDALWAARLEGYRLIVSLVGDKVTSLLPYGQPWMNLLHELLPRPYSAELQYPQIKPSSPESFITSDDPNVWVGMDMAHDARDYRPATATWPSSEKMPDATELPALAAEALEVRAVVERMAVRLMGTSFNPRHAARDRHPRITDVLRFAAAGLPDLLTASKCKYGGARNAPVVLLGDIAWLTTVESERYSLGDALGCVNTVEGGYEIAPIEVLLGEVLRLQTEEAKASDLRHANKRLVRAITEAVNVLHTFGEANGARGLQVDGMRADHEVVGDALTKLEDGLRDTGTELPQEGAALSATTQQRVEAALDNLRTRDPQRETIESLLRTSKVLQQLPEPEPAMLDDVFIRVDLNLDAAVELIKACDVESLEADAVKKRQHTALLVTQELYAGVLRAGRMKGPPSTFAQDAERYRLGDLELALQRTAGGAQLADAIRKLHEAMPAWLSIRARWLSGELILAEAIAEARKLDAPDRHALLETLDFNGTEQDKRLRDALRGDV